MEVDDTILNDEFVLSTTYTTGTEVGVRSGAVVRVVGGAEAAASTPPSSQTSTLLILGDQLGGMAAFDVSSRDMTVLGPHHHGHAVTALLADHAADNNDCEASGDHPSLYVTGCKDNSVRIFRVVSSSASDGTSSTQHHEELVKELKGHDRPVTSLAWATPGPAGGAATATATGTGTSSRYLVTGSWDGTAKVWNLDNHALVATLPDHENSVCVAGLPSHSDSVLRVATGSAGVAQNGTIGNHTVRIWSIDVRTGHVQVEHTVVQDHDGPIRDACTFDDAQQLGPLLATCSNDGTVKVRDPATATALSTLSFASAQHPPMLLSVTALSSTNETILVTGAEDGTVVVFNLTKADAQPQVLLHPSCVWNVVAMPGGDFGACCQDGHFYVYTRAPSRMADAATRQAFEDGVREAHQKLQSGPSTEDIAKLPFWHEAATMRGRSEGQVQLFQRDGIAIAAQWSVASQTWIEVGQVMGGPGGGGGGGQDQGMLDGVRYDHVLPIQVDTANSGTVNLQLGYNNGENPFVAAQRFIDAHVLPQYHLADIADYITQRVGSSARMLGAATGAATAAPVATTGVPLASYAHLPAKTYKTFDVTEKTASSTLEKIKTKIESFQLLSPEQLATLSSLLDTLRGTNRYHASTVSTPELDLVAHMLQSFTLPQCYPALDVARMCVLHPNAASNVRSEYWSQVMQTVAALNDRTRGDEASSLDATAQVAIPMLSLRLLANAFKGGPGSLEAVSNKIEDQVLPLLQSHVASTNKNIRLSVATLLHNVCLFLHSTKAPVSTITSVLTLCRDVLSNRSYEGEAIMRTLVAVGTLVMGKSNGSAAKGAASTLFLASKVELAASPHGPAVKAAAKEVYTVLA